MKTLPDVIREEREPKRIDLATALAEEIADEFSHDPGERLAGKRAFSNFAYGKVQSVAEPDIATPPGVLAMPGYGLSE